MFNVSFDDQVFEEFSTDEDVTTLTEAEVAEEIQDDFARAVASHMASKSVSFASIWHKIGLSASTRRKRVEEMIKYCHQFIDEAEAGDKQALDRMIGYKDKLLKQINEMLSALHESAYEEPSELSLFSACKEMNSKFKELKSIKDERMTELRKLLDQRDNLSDLIAEEIPEFKTETAIPSQKEISQLTKIVDGLKAEKNKRLNRVRDLRQSILLLVEQLDYQAKNDLETIVFAGEESKYILSNANITELLKLNTELEKKVATNEETKASLIKRLQYLWQLLEVPEEDQDQLLAQYTSISDKCISKLRTEQVDKYEQERKKRLVEFIMNIEPHVQDWWAKCYTSDDEISTFRERIHGLLSGSEELLQAWESELARLKSYYSEHEEVFEAIKIWHDLLDELEEVNRKANDPDIYKNRRLPSTYFMTLAKTKKTCETKIAKIEAQLQACKAVKIDGNSLTDYIRTTRDGLDFLNKENQKGAKKQARVPISNISKNKSGSTNSSTASNGKRNRLGAATPENSISPTKMARPLQRSGTITKMKCAGSTTKLNMQRTPSLLSIDSEEIFKINLNGRFDVNSTFKPLSPALRRRSKSSNDLASPMANLALTPSKTSNVLLRRPDYRRPFKP